MKTPFESKLFTYVIIRTLLCSVIICMLTLGLCPFIVDKTIRIVVTIAFSLVMCLYTASVITRHVKDLIANPLNKVLKSAELLAQASLAMTSAAKGISRNAEIMVEFTGLLDDMAEACNGLNMENSNEDD